MSQKDVIKAHIKRLFDNCSNHWSREILRLREKLCLGRDGFCYEAEIHPDTLRSWETNRRIPDIEALDKVLRKFGYRLGIVKLDASDINNNVSDMEKL